MTDAVRRTTNGPDITERLEHFRQNGNLDEYSSEVLYRARMEIETLRSVLTEIDTVHQEWGNHGQHFEAFKGIRTALNRAVPSGR